MAGLDDVALRLAGIAHAEIVGADHHVALPGELGDGELRLGRLLGKGRHLLFPVHRPVLIREHRKARPGGVGDRDQPGRHDRPVPLFRHHRGIGDPVEPHRVHGGRIGHGDAGEGGRIGLEDLVETVHVPAGHEFIGDAGGDRYRRIVLRQRRRRCRHGGEKGHRCPPPTDFMNLHHPPPCHHRFVPHAFAPCKSAGEALSLDAARGSLRCGLQRGDPRASGRR